MNILSRHPILRAVEGDGFEIDVGNGTMVALFNRHIRGYPFAPYDARDGVSLEQILQNEEFHVEQMQKTMDAIERYARQGWPVFLTGDFNVPSHLDWTEQNAANNFGRVIEWPLSKALQTRGIRDSYREVWPDPVARPGHTWTEGWYPPYISDPNEKFDRIDYIYFKGDNVSVVDSQVIGLDKSNPSTDIEISPWGSDHRAVVSTFVLYPNSGPTEL
jgi:exonuclease III